MTLCIAIQSDSVDLPTLTWMNEAVALNDGVIIGGANLGFSTIPYILRIDTSGNVAYSSYFSNLQDGQDQILSVDVRGNQLDLFTWADNTRDSYYMLNGDINGNFPSALQVEAPSGLQYRVSDTEPTGNSREFLVICQSDTAFGSSHEFLILMMIDSAGVQWSFIHDHGTTGIAEVEQGEGISKLSDGNYIYYAIFRGASGILETRLVKITNGRHLGLGKGIL